VEYEGNFTTLSPPGALSTFANGINNLGQVAGMADSNGYEATPNTSPPLTLSKLLGNALSQSSSL
jgi:hypothetical protein